MIQKNRPNLEAIRKAAEKDRNSLKSSGKDNIDSIQSYHLEAMKLDVEKNHHEIEKLKTQTIEARQLISARQDYAKNIKIFMWFFGILYFVTLFLSGFEFIPFNLPTTVLATLSGATTASVLGVVGAVAAGLFKAPKS